jgi:hypothetical protein
MIYNIFHKHDCIIEISIPGTIQLYKMVQLKK